MRLLTSAKCEQSGQREGQFCECFYADILHDTNSVKDKASVYMKQTRVRVIETIRIRVVLGLSLIENVTFGRSAAP